MKNLFYDIETSNLSFLEVSNRLKVKGINNYKFMLTLYDRDLIGVDPWDENISKDMKKKILIECKKNIWYYFREVLRIKSNGEPERFILDLASCTVIYLSSLCLSNWTNKPRATYNTGTVLALLHYIDLFISSKKRYRIVSKFSYNLNTRFIDLPYYGKISTTVYKPNLLRLVNFFDDAEYIKNIEKMYDKTKFNIFTSTISDSSKMEEFINNSSIKFDVRFFDLNETELKIILNDKDFFYVIYSLDDLGLGQPYLEAGAYILQVKENRDLFRREILQRRSEEDMTQQEKDWIENFINRIY